MANEVAQTILAQFGGSRFIAMTGAKNFVGSDNYLQFDLPRGFASNKANKCRVTLDANDTYTVEFFKWNARAFDMKLISSDSNVYCDSLRAVFTAETGLYTSLAA